MKYSLIHINATELIELRNYINSDRLDKQYNVFENEASNKRKNEVFVDITDNNYKIQTIIEVININGEKLVRDNESPDFYIMLLPLKVLSDYSFFVEFPKLRFRNYNKEDKYNPKPIIFITSLNIFPNYRIVSKKYRIRNREKLENDFNERTKYFSIDHRYQFMDSSIWHYYLPIEKWNGKSFNENLQQILTSISENYKLKLYDTVVAREFLEFQTRLMKNSYLESLGGGHADSVAPFLFHSEQIMKMKAKEVEVDIAKLFKSKPNCNAKIMWNALLIDDYGNAKLNTSDIRQIDKTKKEIIHVILEKFIGSNFPIEIKTTGKKDVLNDAISKIIKGQENNDKIVYDILFLDYLLGFSKDGNKREYGDEFLSKLKDDKKFKTLSGPLDKFWILPISSFNNAMISKLKEEGIGRISDIWYIMDGADMINTPNLFIYNLLKLIYLQLDTAIVTKEDIVQFIIDNKTENDTSKDTNREDVYSMRENARRLYGIFMHRFGLRGALKYDAKQGSAFAKSVLKYMYNERFEDLRFYESVRKLLYLVGFSTHTDVVLMWDLLTYINSVTNSIKFEDKKTDTEKGGKEKVIDFLKEVREYISKLKKSR